MAINMKSQSRLAFASFIRGIVGLSVLLSSLCIAQEIKPDTQSIIRETQQIKNQNHKLEIVWWIPEQFWRASFAANPNLTQEQIDNFLKIVRPYTIVVIVKGDFGPFAGVTYDTATSIRTNLVLIDNVGNKYSPLDDEDTSVDMQNFLSMMKPVFANMLGSMGKNFDFFTFPANDKNGKLIANPLVEGRFTVQLGGDKFNWRLPLGSLLPPKICPKCGEKLSGAYKFCPYDGTPLDK
jgi:hypothetical protein